MVRSVHYEWWYLLGVFALWLLCTPSVLAGDLRFERIMTETGISVAETNAIAQDAQGYIWIGGSNGLVRYNGHSYDVFLHNPDNIDTLSNNFVWDILVGQTGDIWVATTNGLNRFLPETQTFRRYVHSSANPGSLISNDVYTLYEDQQGRMWVGTRNGLDRFDADRGGFYHFRHNASDPESITDNNITAIFEDARGTLWIGTQNGLNRYNEASESFSRFEPDNGEVPYDPAVSIRDIAEDREQNLWVGTDSGLYRFNQEDGQAQHYHHQPDDPTSLSDDRVWKLLVDSKDTLWIATDHGGINVYQRDSDQFKHYRNNPYDSASLASDQVRQVFEDNAGDYWVALFPSGVDYANHTAAAFNVFRHQPQVENSLNNDSVLSIGSGPGNKIWIGSEGGLNLFDPASKQMQSFRHEPGNPASLGANAVLAMTRDRNGDYWFGTWSGGLNRYLPKSQTFERYMPKPGKDNSVSSAYIWSLLGDSKGNLWIGTESGALDRYHLESGQFTHFVPDRDDPKSISGGFMRAIVEDHQGVIWIATLQGLNRFDEETQSFTSFQYRGGDSTSIPHNSVAAIFEDSKKRLWVGTESGLALMDRESGTFTSYTTAEGLPNNSVMGIREDNSGDLWINTLQGLSRFDPETERFTNFTQVNGLAGNIMNRPAIHFADGWMYVGSTKGLTQFRPENVQDNPFVPPVVLSGFKVFNQPVSIGSELLQKHINLTDSVTLDYKTSMFAFEFAALNYRNSAANQYTYRMQGFDQQWIDAGSDISATYTNLNPGHYTFTVRGSNNNGVWNEEGHSIDVIILPPPWHTWWAYCIYGVMFFCAAYLFWRSQRRKIEFEQQKVAHLRAVDKLKDEFLANTSHELRTPLNGIVGLTESLIDDPDAQMSEKVRSYLHMIAGSGRRLSNLINDILDFSKIKNHGLELRLESLDFGEVCDAVCVMSRPLAYNKSIEILNELPPGLPPVLADGDRLQQVLYNLIGNAIKFTSSGYIKITAEADEAWVKINIEDTGIGIPESELENIFESFTQAHGDAGREYEGTGLGLAVAKNLIEIQGGRISVESTLNKGSTFTFTLQRSHHATVQSSVRTSSSSRLNSIVDTYSEVDSEVLVTESPNVTSCKFHILVVDDDAVNRQVLLGQLSLHDYRVSEAVNGQEALDAVRNDDSIDLVLLDVMMPRMTGYETAMQIRAIKPVHELPIIFITAKHLASDLVAGFVAGGNDFLIKPVSKNELLSRTKTHLLLLDVTRNLEHIVEERTNTLREAQQSLETVDTIVNLINQQRSLDGLAKILLKESALLLNHKDAGAFWLLDETGEAFQLIASHGDAQATGQFPSAIHKHYLVHSGKNVLRRGVQVLAPETLPVISDASATLDGLLVMAIETENETTGLLVFINRSGRGQFSKRDEDLFARLETHAISAVAKARMLELLKTQNEQLEELSFTDQLTGLNNRRHLLKYLEGDVALCQRRYKVSSGNQSCPIDGDLIFLLIDIDHFKAVNDTYGHHAGDIILQKISTIVKGLFRESDHVVRWGGEEFLVVLRFVERETTAQMVERLRQAIEQSEFKIDSQVTLKKTCSIGFSSYPFYPSAPQAYTWEQVVEVADKCLYIAKRSQRNAWVGAFGARDVEAPVLFPELADNFQTVVNSDAVTFWNNIDDEDALLWE